MILVDVLLSSLGLLPVKMVIGPILFTLIFLLSNHFGLLQKLGLVKSQIKGRGQLVTILLIVVISLLSQVPLFVDSYIEQKQIINPSQKIQLESNGAIQGVSVDQGSRAVTTQLSLDCDGWSICTDFKTDVDIDNKYYRHTSDDPQKIILESGPFTNPPLYFKSEVSTYYSFQLDVQPLGSDAANVFVESEGVYQVFIGDNDYRSLAFLRWDQENSTWLRSEDSKIYLERDLDGKDIEPKTQLTITVDTKKKGSNAEVLFSLIYKSVEGKKETVSFTRVVDIPAVDPERFKTKVGTGMFRSKGNIPQAKFYFMGIKIK